MLTLSTVCVLLLASAYLTAVRAAEPILLHLEAKIALGDVRGRIDHMAVDVARFRLYVAELGNNTVGIVDLNKRQVIHRIVGLKEPQGVAYVSSSDMLYVANAGDGSVRLFRAEDFAPAGRIDLGNDADNIRVDSLTHRVFVGYGGGALAVIDPSTRSKIGNVPLKAHPESFQLDSRTSKIFVNVPDAHTIEVVDRVSQKQIAAWPMADQGGNFPMALDNIRHRVLVVFRNPAKLGVFSMTDGTRLASAEICGDADDVFIDEARERVYVSCGQGFVDILDLKDISYRKIAHMPTVSGARTSLFVPDLDLFLLAVRASSAEPSAIWIFRLLP